MIALAVVLGAFRDLDRTVLDAAQSVPLPAVDLFSSVVGLFGLAELTAAIALGIAVARFRHHRPDAVLPLFILAVIALESLLKIVVPQSPPPHERSRTIELVPFLNVPFTNSFPSGHVARSAFLLRVGRGTPSWVIAGAIVLMAATRVYLGEHWLSDTIGGAVLGLGVADLARRLA